MVVSVLQGDGYRWLGELIERCHEDPKRKRRLRRQAAERFRSLRQAGIVELTRERESGRCTVTGTNLDGKRLADVVTGLGYSVEAS